jgi:hypothetical protein
MIDGGRGLSRPPSSPDTGTEEIPMRRHGASAGAALLIGLALMSLGGCETDDRLEALAYVERSAGGQDLTDTEHFHPEVTLYRRYTGSKWRRDKDHIFTVKDESHVRAQIDLQHLRPDRTYTIHLAWIRPDGREMFRRHAEVTRHLVTLPEAVLPDSTGALPAAYVAQLDRRWGAEQGAAIASRLAADPDAAVPVTERIYKKAEDLGYARTERSLTSEPTARLTSRLNISREKERLLGEYILRIYLDRRLLQEIPFTVQEKT